MTKARSNATAKAAKGDLTVGSGTNLSDVLAVGNNGETLVADSSTSTGLRYNPSQAAGKNVLINGAFDIWQRGTSFATGSLASPYFVADRWQSTRSGAASGATISRQTSGAPTGFQYYVRLQRDSGNTGTAAINLGQCVETSMSLPYANQTVTLSFYARVGANYVSSANNVNLTFFTGTGTDQNNFSSSYTGVTQVLGTTATVTTSWQRFSYTITLASTVTEFEPLIYTQHTGTAGAADYLDITGVQLELGSVATAFTRAGGTIQGELAACQRYYQVATRNGTFGVATTDSTTSGFIPLQFVQQMRTAPTVTFATAGQAAGQITLLNVSGGFPATTGSHAANSITVNGFEARATGYSIQYAAGGSAPFYANGSTNVYVASAEL